MAAASCAAPVGSMPAVLAPASRKKSSRLPSLQPMSSAILPVKGPIRSAHVATRLFIPESTSAVKRER
ncbi:hypothetical protein QCM80_18755 [Bradyrhizobium sp. SSUT112]|uniref:hypothetical protein n=1 Tax=Bradyrhizobium sp. SSUT112 TaxID=3040604 RepID=UPI00244BA30E|nr:hypothetical protein [Bradyrhizobium sp. SSUT112]MDH2352678.1 hypothetical protein [Bradyrhizobium sp. SSUT112]